jgi:hypothetical protein
VLMIGASVWQIGRAGSEAPTGLTGPIRDQNFTAPPLVESHLASGVRSRLLRKAPRGSGYAAPLPFTASLLYDIREPKEYRYEKVRIDSS